MKTLAKGTCGLVLAMASASCGNSGAQSVDSGPLDAGAVEAAVDGTVDAPQDVQAAPESGSPQDAADSAAFQEAPRAPYPQIPTSGGPTLTALKLVTITFAGYNYEATVSAFADWIVASHWLSVVGSDYGIGPGTHVTSVVLPGPVAAQVTDLDTQALLETNLANGNLPSAEGADAGTPADAGAGAYLYMIFYPPGTDALSFLAGPTTCAYQGGGSFIGGYHWETQSGAYHVPYAVVPTCTSGVMVEKVVDVEVSASHELIEAATDPLPYTAPAYALMDPTSPWTFLDGEVADLCEVQTTTEATFSAQRVWSNTAARGSGSPCVPAPAGTFFGTSPMPDTTQQVAAGQSATFTITGFSTAPMPAWSIQAFVGYSSFMPTLNLSAGTIANGQRATLSVTVPAGTPSQGFAVVLVSSYTSLTDLSYWPVAVTVP